MDALSANDQVTDESLRLDVSACVGSTEKILKADRYSGVLPAPRVHS